MRNHAAPGDIGLKPFSGCVTTILAAERMRWRAAAIGLDLRPADAVLARKARMTKTTELAPEIGTIG